MKIKVDLDSSVITISINRPEKRNALDMDIIRELIDTLEDTKNNPNIRIVIITGIGKAFSAGGDISEMQDRYGKAIITKYRLDDGLNKIVRLIRSIRRPVIAAVNGACFGAGLVIATACDVIYAKESAKFGFSHGNMGLIPEGSYFLARIIGLHKIKELVFSRSIISAKEAYNYGLINKIIQDEEFEHFIREISNDWASGPIEAMGLAKEVLNHAFEMPLESHLQFEALAQGAAFTGKNHKEGVKAFMEKRDPDFTK